MAYTVKLEERELNTIADLVAEELERTRHGDGSYVDRSLVRLALALLHVADGHHARWQVLRRAPRWVFEYLGKPIIEFAAAKPAPARRAPKPKPRRRHVGDGMAGDSGV